ncbi:DUF4170 domain-containing protein [Kiloniella sp. b19]|uniref:DUF4170 domain-containing protein n=1 Tax=Kiloniella sp. GXU_MW_B19 TaxID=3141326 RepID=UPI0031CEE423
MAQFFVVGGEYKDTSFADVISGEEKWFGPFADYASAKAEWSKYAWKTVDECTMRYRIERIDDDDPHCTD